MDTRTIYSRRLSGRRRRKARSRLWAAAGITAALCATSLLAPNEALAKKKGPLEGEPSVRNKLQLRKFRVYLTPLVAMSLSQPFVHMGYVGGRVGVHFTDWIGLRAGFAWGLIPLDSQLLKDMVDVPGNQGIPEGIPPGEVDQTTPNGPRCDQAVPCRPVAEEDNPAPLRHDFKAGLVRAQWQSSIDVVFTPFAGKLGLFSAIFTEYDIYIFGGVGIMGWAKHYENAQSTAEALNLDTNPNNATTYCQDSTGGLNTECLLHPVNADVGTKVGGSFGGGMHLFITDWVGINLEVQDIVNGQNLTGLNATVEDVPPVVNDDDKNAFHNVTFQLGATFYFPPKAKRSR